MDESSIQYFKQCTDAQLENCLADEFVRHQQHAHGDSYAEAQVAAASRGWIVRNGKRV